MARYALTTVDTHSASHKPTRHVCHVRESGRALGRWLDIELEGTHHAARVLSQGNPFLVLVNQRPIEVYVEDGRYTVLRRGGTFEQSHTAGAGQSKTPQASALVLAPMPGKVVRVLCQIDNIVEVGTPLVVLEAMKMENELCATRSGRVVAVHVCEGQAVESRTKLIELG